MEQSARRKKRRRRCKKHAKTKKKSKVNTARTLSPYDVR